MEIILNDEDTNIFFTNTFFNLPEKSYESCPY